MVKAALVAFLGTLTDDSFINNALFSDPFVTLAGDYDGDGLVDSDDFAAWQSGYGDSEQLLADGNLDGLIDGQDYAIWRENLGASWEDLAANAASNPATAPEPSATLLIALASAIATARFRRRRSSVEFDLSSRATDNLMTI